MIHYSIDTEPRSRIHFYSAALALCFSLAVPYVLKQANARVLVPSAFAVYGALLFAFNRWLWKMRPFTLIAGVPNVSGTYRGEVHINQTSDHSAICLPVEATITQTWLKIEMILTGPKTISNLTVCGFQVENQEKPRLIASYLVKNRAHDPDANHYGEGSQELNISIGEKTKLTGSYYSTKGRGGLISLEQTAA